MRYDLDAIIVFTHAPGQSAYNPAECRMARLSQDVSSIILPYDTYGSHLDGSKRTNDIKLEKQNFKAAANILADVWSESVIDGYQVTAQYVEQGLWQYDSQPIWRSGSQLMFNSPNTCFKLLSVKTQDVVNHFVQIIPNFSQTDFFPHQCQSKLHQVVLKLIIQMAIFTHCFMHCISNKWHLPKCLTNIVPLCKN